MLQLLMINQFMSTIGPQASPPAGSAAFINLLLGPKTAESASMLSMLSLYRKNDQPGSRNLQQNVQLE